MTEEFDLLRIVTKKEYWDAENEGVLELMPQPKFWYLKTIQDVIALDHIKNLNGKRIAEIGGGDSRVLPVLKENNHCFNIDEFKGLGQGPTLKTEIDGIENIYVNVGEFSSKLDDESFDVIFSISVIEHIPTNNLNDFFLDSVRILKPGGTFIHLIDIYIEDDDSNNKGLMDRVSHYKMFFEIDAVESTGNTIENEDIRFSCAYATNPDNIMNSWNKLVPNLKQKRESSQSCSLLLMATKKWAV